MPTNSSTADNTTFISLTLLEHTTSSKQRDALARRCRIAGETQATRARRVCCVTGHRSATIYRLYLNTHISMPASNSRLSTTVNVNNWTHNHFDQRGAISHAGRRRIGKGETEGPRSSEHRPRGLAAARQPPPLRMRRLLVKWAD